MKKFVLLLCLFTCLTLIITWPLVINLNQLIIDRGDGLLITWFLNWSIFHPLNYSANIFYPYQNTLAFSETMLPQAFLVAPIVLLFHEPLLAYNLNFLLGFILTGVSTFYLVYHLTHRNPIALLCGMLLTFSTIHLNYMAHLQLFSLYPVILAILFLLRQNKKLFIFFFVVSSLTTVLFFYFLTVFVLWQKKFVWLCIAALITLPFLVPYFLVSRQFGYQRPITDAINFSLQIPDLANVSVYSRLNSLIPQLPNSTRGYLGSVFLILALLSVIKPKLNAWLVIAGTSFVLALGPALHVFRTTIHVGPIPVIPLPYTILYYIIPGFSGLRTPSRWILLVAIALVVAIGLKFKRLGWPWSLVLATIILLEVNFPFRYHSVPPVPPEQLWLKNHYVGKPIIQFPIYGWFDGDKMQVETLREYYSTYHWHPMYNGYSGFSPTVWENNVKWLQKEFPSDKTLAFLRAQKIKLILTPQTLPLKLVASFPGTNIYEL